MKRTIQIVLSIVLSAFFIWWSLLAVPVAEMWGAVKSADLRWIGVYALVLCAIHVARVARWGVLLEPLVKVRFRDLNPIGAVGFMVLMVLPFRLGELARPYLCAEHLNVRKSAAMASVVVERIVDGLFMGLILVVLLWTVPQAGAENFAVYRMGAIFVTAAFGAGLAFLFAAFRYRELVSRLLSSSVGRVSPRIAERVTGMLDSFTEALRVVPTKRKIAEFFLLTALYWGLAGVGLALLANAFGFKLATLEAFTVLGLQVIGSMIPTGPGMTGPIQVATIKGVELFVGTGLGAAVAAFAHTIWAMQFSQQVAFGLVPVLTGRVRLAGFWRVLGGDAPAESGKTEPGTAADA